MRTMIYLFDFDVRERTERFFLNVIQVFISHPWTSEKGKRRVNERLGDAYSII